MKKNSLLKVILLGLFSLTVASCQSTKDPTPIDPIIDDPEPVVVTLSEFKENAIEELVNYLNKDNYYQAELAEIDFIINEYTKEINSCVNKQEVTETKEACIVQLGKVKTKEQIDNEKPIPVEDIPEHSVYNYMNKVDHYDVLMLGSSYLYYFNQPEMLENILLSDGYDVSVDSIYRGSATLEMFTNKTDELNNALLKNLQKTQYEYIILEELSTRPLKKYDLFETAVGNIIDIVNTYQEHAEVMLFQTWARDSRCDWYNENPTYTYDSMYQGLKEAYDRCAQKYDLRVSRPGNSFNKAYKDGKIDLYYSDYTHPNENGAYLSALTHYVTLTNNKANNASYRPNGLATLEPIQKSMVITESDANLLKSYVDDMDAKTLNVYCWMSSSSVAYYNEQEVDYVKRQFTKVLKDKITYKWTNVRKVSAEEFKNFMLTVDDADIVLAGGNMDSTVGLSLLTDNGYEKAKTHPTWFNKDARYVGILASSTRKERSKAFRDMLIEEDTNIKTRILFIGNSYTFYNDMYLMFNDICNVEDRKARAYKVTYSSRYLTDYATDDDTTLDLKNKLENIKFDYIFLQDQSSRPIKNKTQFNNGVKLVSEIINSYELNKGAEIILYATWARNEGNSFYTDNPTYTYKSASKELSESYKNVANTYGYGVSYAGAAMYDIHNNHPEITIYHTDNTHPSACASYMIAMCHYAKVFGVDPRTINYIPYFEYFSEGGAKCIMPTKTEITILKEAAYNATYNFSMNIYN